jgi:phage FluMu gp28-like protein
VDKSATKDDALKNAILAAELYIKATSQARSDHDKARLREKCKQLLSRAEEIKQSPSWIPKTSKGIYLKAPISERAISRQEEIILLEGSKLHGFIFPRWTSDPEDSVFEEIPEGSSFYM